MDWNKNILLLNSLEKHNIEDGARITLLEKRSNMFIVGWARKLIFFIQEKDMFQLYIYTGNGRELLFTVSFYFLSVQK